MSSKNVLLSMFLCVALASHAAAGDAPENGLSPKVQEDSKPKMSIKAGDAELTFAGEMKIEHYFNKNIEFLNDHLPDQSEYFKHLIDLTTHFVWGKKTYGRPAVEFYTRIRHKGVWGLGAVFADSDSTQPTKIKLSDSRFGYHSHISGKPMLWINTAWLQLNLNSIIGCNLTTQHSLKAGWFSFELGRGIALGSVYGMNRELLGVYSYPEDKSAPGILLTGEIIKDCLMYDIYYAKFEERNKSCKYTLDLVKGQLLANRKMPWRGTAKDDELIAGQLTWLALNKSKYGTLELRPYVFYNEASDQTVEIPYDTKTQLGSVGLYAEHAYKSFEIGGELAFNYGQEKLKAIDRNNIEIVRNEYEKGCTFHDDEDFESEEGFGIFDRDDRNHCCEAAQSGRLEEVYTQIYDRARLDAEGKPRKALVTPCSKQAARVPAVNDCQPLPVYNTRNERILVDGLDRFYSAQREVDACGKVTKKGRFRPCFKNHLRGWMGVIDAAYTFNSINFKVAAAFGLASGDKNPNIHEVDKNYHEFIGLHESYSGKRVRSLIVLDERLIKIPDTLYTGDTKIAEDFAFSDLIYAGISAQWKPAYFESKKLTIQPNVLCFWRDHTSKKFDEVNGVATAEDASRFMGTEIFIETHIEPLKDLLLYSHLAAFVPGQFFTDISGVPINGKDFFKDLQELTDTTGLTARRFRINDNSAYYVRCGMRYRF